jgi:CO/xanthine dehydrogenase FAD-binding subunit
VDLIRAGISRSEHLVDINDLPLRGVEGRADGGLHIGAPALVGRPADNAAFRRAAAAELRDAVVREHNASRSRSLSGPWCAASFTA